ncbi:MAG: radical SAM protein [Planctomycetota bacterium]
MRVLFLEVDTERSWAVASLGPAFLAPSLRRAGHEPEFLRAPLDWDDARVVAEVRARNPELLGLSLTTRQWQRARALVAALRAELDVPVVAGGLHPTFAPEEVLARPGFDYAVLGEGEGPIVDLANALAAGGDGRGIDNVWVRGGGRPKLRPPFEPLDGLPWMDRDFLDEHHGVIHMTTQRGCPFPCTYCGARMFDQLYAEEGERYGRRRSHESVLQELEAIRAARTLAYVIFLDDTFTINHPWVKGYCPLHRERIGVSFSLHARVETVSEPLLRLLADAGCKHITYGVESGSERIRRDVMRRPVANQRFKDVFRWTREAGILVTANYMLGLPGETPADLQATLDLAEELEAEDFGYFVFYPYPGTQLFKHCLEQGYLPPDYQDLPAVHRRSILRLPTLTQADIDDCYERFTALRARQSAKRAGAAHVQESASTG